MPRITVDLLRKRSEHNEGIISTMEEISLHQEELEKIEVIGTMCRKLQILYLQNNIIEKIEDLTHMKDLKYLNLALNSIKKIEGLSSCEFLEKLDLTVNFIDFDTLEESIDHLKPHEHLKELYMMGNPCHSNWPDKFQQYVMASLPQLKSLDGKEITRGDRIVAMQRLPQLVKELSELREEVLREKLEKEEDNVDVIEVVDGKSTDVSTDKSDEDEKLPYNPDTRRSMYLELAEQKEEEEKRRTANHPKERNYEKEHKVAVEKARNVKTSGEIRQCNEGKWEFKIDDEKDPACVVIEVGVPRFLDSSLIDIDCHPTYISIVIKNKVLRLRLPEECFSDAGKAIRSKLTGSLIISLPKCDEKSIERARRAKAARDDETSVQRVKKTIVKNPKVGEKIMEASKAVKIHGIVTQEKFNKNIVKTPYIKEVASSGKGHLPNPEDEDGSDIPPMPI